MPAILCILPWLHSKNLRRAHCRFLTVKSLAEFAASAANKVIIIFCRGVYLADNTSQAARVEFVYRW